MSSVLSNVRVVLNALVRRTYWYNNIAFPNCAKFWKHNTFELDVVNLGSSSALAAFDYLDYPQLKSANWAMASQTLVADYEILRNYSCYLKKGAIVLIPLCPFSCLGGSNDDLADIYYTILNIASIPHASFRCLHIQQQKKNNPWIYYPLAQLFGRNPRKKDIEKKTFEADAQMRMKNWKKEFSIIHYTAPLSLVNKDAYKDGAEILSKIVDYCLERAFQPVLVMPPISEALRKQFSPEMKKLFVDDFVKMGIGNKTIFLDHFADNQFSDEQFQNSFILNRTGARLFTNIILKEIGLTK